MKREKTRYQGVYQRRLDEHFKGKPDISFDITFKHNGRKIWEKVGKLSEGYSALLASDVRAERIRAKRHGEELPYERKQAVTFNQLAERYLKWSAENKKSSQIDKNRYENHLKERFQRKRLNDISPFDLEKMKSDMAKAGYAPMTIFHCLALIRTMFNKAISWGLFDGINPVKKISMPKVQNTRDRFLSVDEAEKLLTELKRDTRYKEGYRQLKDPKLHDITLLSLHTGARAGEIFNLKGSDLDFGNSLISLRDTKNTETRYAPMTSTVKEMLLRRSPENPNDYVFSDVRGCKIKEVSNAFERAVKRLKFNDGVKDNRQKVVFHTCRHTFASWLAIQGTPILTIARLMGHKTLAMSMRYAHLSPDHKRDAVKGIEAAINGWKSAQEKQESHKK